MSAAPRRTAPALSKSKGPKPWPMKWVVAVIVVCLALYTFFTLKYRKDSEPYRPYEDGVQRTTTARLLAGGWSRIPVTLDRPVDQSSPAATPAAVTRADAGLGAELDAAFVEKPKMLTSVGKVVAPTEVRQGEDYSARFRGKLPDLHGQIGAVLLYQRGSTLVLIPVLESLPDKGLLSRWEESSYQLRFSTQSLPPGRYQVNLRALGPAAGWSFTVRE